MTLEAISSWDLSPWWVQPRYVGMALGEEPDELQRQGVGQWVRLPSPWKNTKSRGKANTLSQDLWLFIQPFVLGKRGLSKATRENRVEYIEMHPLSRSQN